MSKPISILSKHYLVYGIGSAISTAGGFILIPLYTNLLTTAEYGSLELLNKISNILILVIFMGSRQAYIRYFFDKNTTEWQQQVTGTMIIFCCVGSIVTCSVFILFRNIIVKYIFQNEIDALLIVLLLAWIPFEMVFNIGMSLLQIKLQSKLYVIIHFFKLLFYVGINIYLLYYKGYGVEGVLISQLIVSGVISLIFLIYLITWSKLKFSNEIMLNLVRFGLPYLPAGFFMYLVSNADRYFISQFDSFSSLGIYALAFKIGMTGTMLFVGPFLKVWSPFLYKHHDHEHGPQIISEVFMLFTAFNLMLALGISVYAPYFMPLISGDEFRESINFIPIICLTSVFYGMHHLADAGILISKQTKYKPFIFGISAVVAIVGNFIFVPFYGAYGAAFVGCFSYFTMLVMTTLISRRFYYFHISLAKILFIFILAVITYFVSMYISENLENLLLAITGIFLVLIMQPIIMIKLRIIDFTYLQKDSLV